MTDIQIAALDDIQKWIIDSGINMNDLSLSSLHPKLILLRYLRANGFNVEKAQEHITTNVSWRENQKLKEICSKSVDDILGCNIKDLLEVFPHWHSGFDKCGRPVLYKQYGGFEADVIKRISSIDAVSNYHIWEQESCMRLCFEQSHRLGYIVETITGVIDVGGMRLGQVTRDFLAIVKAIAYIDQVIFGLYLFKL